MLMVQGRSMDRPRLLLNASCVGDPAGRPYTPNILNREMILLCLYNCLTPASPRGNTNR